MDSVLRAARCTSLPLRGCHSRKLADLQRQWGGETLLKMHYLILLLCPVINARISSSLTCDEFKNINSEWETGSRKFEGAVGNYNNYNKIRESAADMT